MEVISIINVPFEDLYPSKMMLKKGLQNTNPKQSISPDV